MTHFEMTDRRRRRPKVVPRAASDFVWQLKSDIFAHFESLLHILRTLISQPSHPETCICPQVNFRKSPRGFRRYLSHWLTFGSDITAPSTIPIFHWNQAKSANTDFFLSQLKSPETPKMGLISISNDKNANWTKFEWNPLENSRFQFLSAGTPDSQRTFFVLALTPLRMVQFSIF